MDLDWIKVCPECGGEYRMTAQSCADCGGPLVEQLAGDTIVARKGQQPAAPPPPPPGAELVEPVVLERGTAEWCDEVSAALGQAGLAFARRVAEVAGSSELERRRLVDVVLVQGADLEAAQAAIRRHLAEVVPDFADQLEAAEVTACPACGEMVADGAGECPECGLVLGGEEAGD